MNLRAVTTGIWIIIESGELISENNLFDVCNSTSGKYIPSKGFD